MTNTYSRLHESHEHRQFVSEEYLYYAEDWITIRDCLAGERAVKRQNVRYLPKLRGHERDATDARYKEYLNRATFFNACSRTTDALVGSLFRRPPSFLNTTPELRRLLGWNKTFTRKGDPFTTAARAAAEEVVSVGRYGLFLDRGPQTNDPLFVAPYKAEHILNYSTRIIDGRVQLDLVVLYEHFKLRDPVKPLAWNDHEQIRVLELDENNEYFQWIYPNHQSTKVYPTRRGQRLNFIPFIFLGPKDLNPEIQRSPLLDIARMNISHYRSYATLEHGRHYTAMPVYVAKYDADNTASQEQVPVNERNEPTYYLDADSVWEMSSEDDALILEYRGSGLKFLENALETKENQIQSLGGRLIASNRGAPAQSGAALELQALGEAATLSSISQNLSEAFSLLMRWWSWWDDLVPQSTLDDPEQAPGIKFTVNFNENKITPRELRAMQSLYKEGILPVDAIYHSFREAGIIPSDMSLEKYHALLDDPSQVPDSVDYTQGQPPGAASPAPPQRPDPSRSGNSDENSNDNRNNGPPNEDE